MGNPPFAAWHADHADVALADLRRRRRRCRARGQRHARAPRPSTCSRLAGAENLAGKVAASTSPTRSTSRPGFPPTLFVKDTDSLGEQVQRAFPEARVVKTLNTLNADLMVHPAGARREQHGLRLR